MQRRKQLQYPGCPSPPNMSPPHESSSQSSLLDLPSGSSSTSLFNALSPHKKDIPIFTFRQVSMICERMLKDREDQVRQEYNSVLTCKLAGIHVQYFSYIGPATKFQQLPHHKNSQNDPKFPCQSRPLSDKIWFNFLKVIL